jgi:hypothetical protein
MGVAEATVAGQEQDRCPVSPGHSRLALADAQLHYGIHPLTTCEVI